MRPEDRLNDQVDFAIKYGLTEVGRQAMRDEGRIDWLGWALLIAYNLCMAAAVAAFCMMTYLAVR